MADVEGFRQDSAGATKRFSYAQWLRNRTTQECRDANVLIARQGEIRTEEEYDSLYQEVHYSSNLFSTRFRLSVRIFKILLRNWKHPLTVRREMTQYFPMTNSNLPIEKSYLDSMETSIPNLLMPKSYYGPSRMVNYE